MRVTFLEPALLELAEAADWYGETNVATGPFRQAVESAIDQIATYPMSGQDVRGRARRVLLSRYPYQLIYRIRRDGISILAVAHTSRRPGYWRNRDR